MMRKMLQTTLQSIPIARPEPTDARKQNLCLDKGCDYNEVREGGKVFSSILHIRARKEEAQAFKRQVGWKRKTMSSGAHAQLDEPVSRGVDPAFEKKVENYLGLLHLACAWITSRAAGLLE